MGSQISGPGAQDQSALTAVSGPLGDAIAHAHRLLREAAKLQDDIDARGNAVCLYKAAYALAHAAAKLAA